MQKVRNLSYLCRQMRAFRTIGLAVGIAMTVMLGSCIADEVGGVYLVSQEPDCLYSVANHAVEITFQAGGPWRASTSADWLEVSPSEGTGGRNAVVVMTTATNKTRAERAALLTITSDGKQQQMTIRQSGDYAIFDQREYQIGPEGGPLSISFTSNIDRSNLFVSYLKQNWVTWSEPEMQTRGDWHGRLKELTVDPNPSDIERETFFILITYGQRKEMLPLDTVRVVQMGMSAL